MVEIIQQIQNIDPNRRAINMHGKIEHNLAECAKYYSHKSTKKSGSNEFTREFDYNKREFSGHW
jgi:hypothetical protein